MNPVPHIPILRQGRPYESVEKLPLIHHATGEIVATVSQANAGLISRDIHRMDGDVLEGIPMARLLEICRKAAGLFMEAKLPLGETVQTFDDYIRQLSATTGMPQALCRNNAKKIHRSLDEMPAMVAGLTRGFDLSILDRGWGSDSGRVLSWQRQARVFGAVLPSNSPGVHTLWIPALALKTPTVLKPGREEPWTPLRVLEALAAAGFPREAFGFYPTDHGGAAQLLLAADRSMIFGDSSTTAPWKKDPRVQLHGPGFSKVILGDDAAKHWEQFVDVIVSSILANGGRSCINASAVWTPTHGRKLAEALARRLAEVRPLSADDPQAQIAAFADPNMARRMNQIIDQAMPGAEDLTRKLRGSDRLVPSGRCAYLLPTIIWCEADHPLANREFLFPYASVIECPTDQMLERIGPTLVVSAITEDAAFRRRLLACQDINRLNFGAIPTWQLAWDQPHEGNLFEHLYRQRAFQAAGAAS